MLTKVNTSWLEADISFFPFFKKETVDYKKYLPKTVCEKNIVGVASLPPYFPNRLNFFKENGKTYFGKNKPLVFSFFDYPLLEETTLDEYWNQIMLTSQKEDCPSVWILAPNELCDFLFKIHIREESENFYLHGTEKENDCYFAVEYIAGKIDLHFLF